jgi:putative ABC transport system ATP-binding protein
LLRDLNSAGTTVVVITHDLQIAAGLPRQVAIRDGHVHHDTGTPEDNPVHHDALGIRRHGRHGVR